MPDQELTAHLKTRLNILSSALSNDSEKDLLNLAFKDKNGNWAGTLKELKEVGVPEAALNRIEFVHALAEITGDNERLVSRWAGLDRIENLRTFALTHDTDSINDLLGEEGIPSSVPGTDSAEKKNNYAAAISRKLFALEPSAVLHRMVTQGKLPVNEGVTTFLSTHPDFNIKTTSVYEVLKKEDSLKDIPPESKQVVTDQLKKLQRITAVSPAPEAVPVLYHAQLHTAFQISEIPPHQFRAAMLNSGLDTATIDQIHALSQQVRVRGEHALMAIKEAGEKTGIALIDKSLRMHTATNAAENAMVGSGDPGVNEVLRQHNLSWDLLFGDADVCDCDDCSSVYGAASYFVELLQYLRNNNLDENAGGVLRIKDPRDISGTPLQKFFNRRPDLGCLELTCPNTNTILPYVDLVNEVMENYVAFKHLKPFNVDGETSSELLAEPQHTEYQAYCILKHEVYPFTLPYHQPIDAARIYLRNLETSRYELIKTFQKNINNADGERSQLKAEVIERAKDAEFLGLTKEEYIILTKESFESIALFNNIGNHHFTAAEYREKIGVKPLWQYYGYDDEASMFAATGIKQVKKEFLRRTGIDYFNLVDLLKTEYINPHLPKGKVKAILESLRFSYRYLQHYARQVGLEKMADDLVHSEKLVDMLEALRKGVGLLIGKSKHDCPNPSGEALEISDKDIKHWVKCHFERVGKMMVIETGKACLNGTIWQKASHSRPEREMAKIENCTLYRISDWRMNNDINEPVYVEMGTVDKETGKVSFLPGQELSNEQVNSLKFLEYRGIKGEKGSFLKLENDLYLLAEQIDSCNLDTAVLLHLDGTAVTPEEYDRIHRFIRLWRKLGWTIDETDKAIAGLSVEKKVATDSESPVLHEEIEVEDHCYTCDSCDDCDDCRDTPLRRYEINTTLLHQLVAVKKVGEKTGLELIKLLSFWCPISTAGENSLYKRLFLKHNVLGMDKVFKADEMGNYLVKKEKMSAHIPVLMASLNLSAHDIEAIRAFVAMDDELTLANVSELYRYRLLSKALGLRIRDFLNMLPLFEHPFSNAYASLRFLKNWQKVEEAGFTWQQLNFILRNVDHENKPFAPSKKDILLLAKTIYDALNDIDREHKDLGVDESIADEAIRLLLVQDQAGSQVVRTKASLLFDSGVVEQIMAFLEGATTFATNCPKNLAIDLPAEKSLARKMMYNAANGNVKLTGILTEAETIDFKALSNDPGWSPALKRIQNQQAKLFKQLFSGIVADLSNPSPEEKAQQAIILEGDVAIPQDRVPDGDPDPNTAPKKRVAFLTLFLPYLRSALTHRFVVATLSNYSGLSSAITDLLITKMLRQNSRPLYQVFEQIKENRNTTGATGWSGYIHASAKGEYWFVVKECDIPPQLTINGKNLDFDQQEDPTNEWWSKTAIELEPGKLYELQTSNLLLKDVYWKTASTSVVSIPTAALIPDFASEECTPALIALKKAALLIGTFDLGRDELSFFVQHKTDFDDIDFNQLEWKHWLRLEAYVRLRHSLPQTSLNILDFWTWTNDPNADPSRLGEQIAGLTLWNRQRVEALMANGHFNIQKLEDFRNEQNLLKLQKALRVADKIGVAIDLLFDWALPTSKFKTCRKIADSIRNAIRAKYDQTEWEPLVKPLHDQLRNHQKQALIAYLLQRKELIDWGVEDADGLFEYFLIDVQMDACMETSRIKQAISSAQLFIQRCFLGLEKEYSDIGPEVLDRKRWEWMQRYRVWEANRKVFLYPENWIESNLRDDKSSFFKELESDLLQKDINKQNVADSLKNYLYKVDEVSNMEVVGLYIDGSRSGGRWSEGARLHVFSRTRNAPYYFYYRYLALDEMNWYPWERMQVDIPSYDVEAADGTISGNGCYLSPVVWNQRLLVFFPQIARKSRANTQSQSGSYQTLGNDAQGIEKSKPVEYFEVKMGWSEYRNGKWTQKQLSKDVIATDPRDTNNDIPYFKFVPIVYDHQVVIDFDDNRDVDGGYKGAFAFNGSTVKKANPVGTGPMPQLYFGQDNQSGTDKMYTWQLMSISPGSRLHSDIVFYEEASKEVVNGLSVSPLAFNLPFSDQLMAQINSKELATFFKFNQAIGDKKNAFGWFDPDNDDATQNSIYHELKRPYSLYVWETFFHAPLMLADALSKAQQFEEAMKWYHYVFDPTAEGTDDKRFWQFVPFKELNSQRILDAIFNNLKPNTADKTISEWRDKPFMPHVVARNRPVAYMKWVVMKYIDNLLAWGDYLFRQDTIETINQATQLYVLAAHILGPRPKLIPKRGKIRPQTYLSLLDKWDAFGNAMTELELSAPFSNQISQPFGLINGEIAFANIFGLASSLYFSIPNNPKLMGYWDTLEDRLYKIRHCENIEGVFRKLPLFEPPIDPALLVSAAAQGLSIASVLNDLNTPLPNYRFYYLLQKSLELCGELKTMGNSLLSALEKKDNESLGLLRARHESAMQHLIMEIKKKQLEEATSTLETLEQSRRAPEHRMKYYLRLVGADMSKLPGMEGDFSELANNIEVPLDESGLKLIPYEKEEMDKAGDAASWQEKAGQVETLASILHIIPAVEPKASPFGVGVGMVVFSGAMLGNAAQAVAKGMQTHSGNLSFKSATASKKAGFLRNLQERIFQANAAGYEIKQIDKQILAQKIRIDLASQEITNQQKQIDNAQEVEEFLKNKFSNEELYTWMRASLKTLYYQVYSLAYDLAKKAEKVYRYERGLPASNFIQFGYWDASREGLLAGERLYVGLKQLEAAYQETRGYDFEVSRTVSLRQVNPLALLQLKEKGVCEFALPEVLFDMDYPGHYRRRIKSVSLTIPCIAGPYSSINATLRLLEHKFRNTPVAKDEGDYPEKREEEDSRFTTFNIPITAIAVSTGLSDAGVFELNFKDERYLPFEGAGVISKWRLEFPAEFRQFDYHTISDAVLQIRYTSEEGGEKLKKTATRSLISYLQSVEDLSKEEGLFTILDLKHDFANEWYKAFSNGRTMHLGDLQERLPIYTRAFDAKKIKARDVYVAAPSSVRSGDVTVVHQEEELDLGAPMKLTDTVSLFHLGETEETLDQWKVKFSETLAEPDRMFLLVRYTVGR